MTTSTIPRAGQSRTLAAAMLLALAAAACSAGGATPGTPGAPATGSGAPSSSAAPVVDLTPVPGVTAKPGVSRVPGLPGSPDAGTGEGVPPAVVQAAVDDAAARAGVDASAVTVVSTESATWPNGALGCPRRGVMYTDVITPGYRVVVEAGGTRYDYRATQHGDVRWCENPPGPG